MDFYIDHNKLRYYYLLQKGTYSVSSPRLHNLNDKDINYYCNIHFKRKGYYLMQFWFNMLLFQVNETSKINVFEGN